MPNPGDQHRDNAATVNPFVHTAHVSEYTASEIATLQSRLDKQLGPEYISTRPGNGGGKVHYLAAEKVINLANEVFGFNGWSSAIQNVQIDFVDENPTSGRIDLGLSAIVRVTLRDGTYHEDIGYGHCENTKGKAAAFEKAKKEAATDGMKRALRNFGNVLGNCLYDKDYLKKITQIKVVPSKWDAENLHRHPDYAPVKKEVVSNGQAKQGIGRNPSVQSIQSNHSLGSAEFEDDFDGSFLEDTDFAHPDEVRLDGTAGNMSPVPRANGHTAPATAMTRTHSMPQVRQVNGQQTGMTPSRPDQPQRAQIMQRPSMDANQVQGRMHPPQTPGQNSRPPQLYPPNGQQTASSSTATSDPSGSLQAQGSAEHNMPPLPQDVPLGIPDGFVTGRKADLLNNPADVRINGAALAFNPHAESPSIRRTVGLNPGKSVPITRQQITASQAAQGQSDVPSHPITAPAQPMVPRPSGPNFVNPTADMHRKIGMPQNPAQRMQNGSAYRPPTATKRPAMADVTNLQQAHEEPDPKKARVEPIVQADRQAGTT